MGRLFSEVLMLGRVGKEFGADEPTQKQGSYVRCCRVVVDGEPRDRFVNKKCKRAGCDNCADEPGMSSELDRKPYHDHQKNKWQGRWRIGTSSPDKDGEPHRCETNRRAD